MDPFIVFYFLFYLLLLEFYTALVFDFCKIWIFIPGINEDFIHSFIYSFIHLHIVPYQYLRKVMRKCPCHSYSSQPSQAVKS